LNIALIGFEISKRGDRIINSSVGWGGGTPTYGFDGLKSLT